MTDPRIEAAARTIYGPGIWEQDQKSQNWNVGIDIGEARTLAALVVEEIDKAATITTTEELEALPVGSILLDANGLAVQLRYNGCWWCTNGEIDLLHEDIVREGLPARVLHFGGTKNPR